MTSPATQREPPPPVLGPDDPPLDFPRELAAYAKEEERLVRDHLGWIALVHGDEVVGAFPPLTRRISKASGALVTSA